MELRPIATMRPVENMVIVPARVVNKAKPILSKSYKHFAEHTHAGYIEYVKGNRVLVKHSMYRWHSDTGK
jgi:hypothetical protein